MDEATTTKAEPTVEKEVEIEENKKEAKQPEEEAVPVETSSETAHFIMTTSTETIETQPRGAIETTSTDSLVNKSRPAAPMPQGNQMTDDNKLKNITPAPGENENKSNDDKQQPKATSNETSNNAEAKREETGQVAPEVNRDDPIMVKKDPKPIDEVKVNEATKTVESKQELNPVSDKTKEDPKPIEDVKVNETKPIEAVEPKKEEADSVSDKKKEDPKPIEEVKVNETKPIEAVEPKKEEADSVSDKKKEDPKPIEEVKVNETKPIEAVEPKKEETDSVSDKKKEDPKPIEEVKVNETSATQKPELVGEPKSTIQTDEEKKNEEKIKEGDHIDHHHDHDHAGDVTPTRNRSEALKKFMEKKKLLNNIKNENVETVTSIKSQDNSDEQASRPPAAAEANQSTIPVVKEMEEPSVDQEQQLAPEMSENLDRQPLLEPPEMISASEYDDEQPQPQQEQEQEQQLMIDTTDYRPNEAQIRPKVVRGPGELPLPSKFCLNITPIRNLFTSFVEPIYLPFVGLMPENLQYLLLEESGSMGGFKNVTCLVFFATLVGMLVSFMLIARRCQRAEQYTAAELNNKILFLHGELKKALFESETFGAKYADLERQCDDLQEQQTQKDELIRQIQMEQAQKSTSVSLNTKEMEKLKASESRLQKELTNAKLELNQLHMQMEEANSSQNAKLLSLESENGERLSSLTLKLTQTEQELASHQQYLYNQNIELQQLRAVEVDLRQKLDEKEHTVELLQTCLLKETNKTNANLLTNGAISKRSINGNSDGDDEEGDDEESSSSYLNKSAQQDEQQQQQALTIDDLMRNAELKLKIKQLENELDAERIKLEAKGNECAQVQSHMAEHDGLLEKLKKRQHELERALKEQEMQVKLLNELREKDTKQHLKSYAELDTQLKKKSSEAEKSNHLLDQLRVKQERIQELESQFSRIEKQSTLERQTFEKQAHENWLSARKFEKELKEAKQELSVLKERHAELEQQKYETNNLIRPIATSSTSKLPVFYMSPSQQQQMLQNNKKSTESSPKTDEANASGSGANEFSQSLSAAHPNASTSLTTDQPLQVDTAAVADVQRPASAASNSGQTAATVAATATAYPAMHYAPTGYMRPPYAKIPAYPFIDQRSSPELMANPQYLNQAQAQVAAAAAAAAGRLLPPYSNPMMFRLYHQQQQQFMQQHQQQQQQLSQQQQQQQIAGGQHSASSSQQPSPRGSVNLNSHQQTPHLPTYSNHSMNGSIHGKLTKTSLQLIDNSLVQLNYNIINSSYSV